MKPSIYRRFCLVSLLKHVQRWYDMTEIVQTMTACTIHQHLRKLFIERRQGVDDIDRNATAVDCCETTAAP